MNFLNPIFLILVSGAAVPLLIHLFSRKRIPEVQFSTLRFLKASDRRSMRRVNLRRLLLLLLRMAAIALAALAFARPVITGHLASLFPGEQPGAVCILLDRSYSMGMAGSGETVFDRAKERVIEIAASLEEEDEVTLILFDERAVKVFNGERFGAAVRDILERETPTFFGTDLGAGVRAGLEQLFSHRREKKELYIVSDFQKSALREGYSSLNLQEGPVVRTFLVPVGATEEANVSIYEVRTPEVPVHRGETAVVGISMRNHSPVLEARFPLRVSFGERLVFEREMTIAPGATADTKIELQAEESGWIKGVARKGPDRLAPDDTRYFTVRSREKIKVILLAGGGSMFLREALSPEEGQSDMEVEVSSWIRLTTDDLESAGALVVGPGEKPDRGDLAPMERFVERGGRVVVFLTEETRGVAEGLSRHGPTIRFGAEGSWQTVKDPGPVPSFLSPFSREDLVAFSRLRFSPSVRITGIPPEDVLLSFRSGHPFIWRERYGEGAVLFIVADPRPEGGDLVLSPLFLPLVHQSVLAMLPGSPEGDGLPVGRESVLDVRPGTSYEMALPGGVSARTVRAGTGRELVLPGSAYPGFIDIYEEGRLYRSLAVNPDAGLESRTARMEANEAADSLGLRDYAVLEDDDTVESGLRAARKGREISSWLAAAAIALLVIELFVAQRKRVM
ncbi:MAG: BatA and WFA domain-containing protein [Candidatus Krumholzibacteria bacterium]|nr:BatA and WFA domain-containing protein [Candidatus Krumholzibacteria bacterium]